MDKENMQYNSSRSTANTTRLSTVEEDKYSMTTRIGLVRDRMKQQETKYQYILNQNSVLQHSIKETKQAFTLKHTEST